MTKHLLLKMTTTLQQQLGESQTRTDLRHHIAKKDQKLHSEINFKIY